MADRRITDVDYIESLNSGESFFVNQNNTIKQINKSNVVLDITNGGTGATTVAGAREALGLGNTDGPLPIANGGTGGTTIEEIRANLGVRANSLYVNAPVGVKVNAKKDGAVVYSKIADSNGLVIFDGLTIGSWLIEITDGEQSSEQPIVIKPDYSVTMTFFSATINVTYPADSDCTCYNSDNDITLEAPDKSGSCTFIVPYAGTWIVSIKDGNREKNEPVSITTEGENKNISLKYFSATIVVDYPVGSTCTCYNPDDDTNYTAPVGASNYTFIVNNVGKWIVSCVNGGESDSKDVDITTDGENKSVILSYKTYLYDAGDECVDITGGWIEHTATEGAKTTVTNGENSLTIKVTNDSGTWGKGYVGPANPIDLTGVDTICLVATATGGNGGLKFGISEGIKTSYIASQGISEDETEYILPVSDYSGEYYISLYGQASAGFNGVEGIIPKHSTTFVVEEMYLD